MDNIGNKVVIVTGASSGIGEAIVRKLAADGAIVVLAARRKDRLEKIAGDINASGGKALYYTVDVTVEKQVRELVDDVVARLGRVDVMVGNAGLMAQAPLSSLKVDEWDRMIDINIKGVLYGVAAVWPVFEKQQSGHFTISHPWRASRSPQERGRFILQPSMPYVPSPKAFVWNRQANSVRRSFIRAMWNPN